MSRPMYEGDADRSNELSAITRMADAFSVEFAKLPISYRMDYAVIKGGQISGFVEVKSRNMTWGQYPNVILSMSKVEKACSYFDLLKLPSLLLVATTDGLIHYTHMHDVPSNSKLEFSGRTVNTRDSADIEPCYHIPNERFSKLDG